MPQITKLRIGDQEFDAIELEFEIKSEDWSEYRLVDGGTIRVKTTVHKIFQVLDANGNPARNPDGDRSVYVRHATQIVASD